MNLPALKIGDLTARYPIVQGGMGIGISLSGLAGRCGERRRRGYHFRRAARLQ